jgi:CheY-like chemotaxis protein
MSSELLLVIIAVVAVTVFVAAFYIFAKKPSAPQTEPAASSIKEIPEIKEKAKTEAVQEIVLQEKEKEIEPPTPITDQPLVTNRRKSDFTIPKRAVPEHLKITKQNFSEFAGERILVAEDNPINQKVIVGLLAGSGIDVVLANDGQEALDILEKDTRFLMILMDAHMPRVDGFEATRIIRANPRYDHILVVALSGDVASDDIQKMKSAGMSEQLEKPLRMESLYKIFYAYTTKEADNEAVTINILDADEGVRMCGGDESFYREILSEFMRDYADSAQRLGELLRFHNREDADALLLDIIGVTANIGGRTLGESASDLKRALSDTDERSYFALYDRYKVLFNRLMQEIREYLG